MSLKDREVWTLLQEYKRKGLSVEFDSSALSIGPS